MTPRSMVRTGSVRGRLTPEERANRELTELDFQRQLVGTKPPGLAVIFGWEHVHFRIAQTKAGWRLPATGSMAMGWPDLVLVRERDRRLVFAELKRELGHERPDQTRVLDVLRSVTTPRANCGDGPHPIGSDGREIRLACCWPQIEVYTWRPSDLPAIAEILR